MSTVYDGVQSYSVTASTLKIIALYKVLLQNLLKSENATFPITDFSSNLS